jgi:hypothetical protein
MKLIRETRLLYTEFGGASINPAANGFETFAIYLPRSVQNARILKIHPCIYAADSVTSEALLDHLKSVRIAISNSNLRKIENSVSNLTAAHDIGLRDGMTALVNIPIKPQDNITVQYHNGSVTLTVIAEMSCLIEIEYESKF